MCMFVCHAMTWLCIFIVQKKQKRQKKKKRQVLTSAGSVGPTEDGALLYRSEGSEQLSHIVFSLLLA